MVAVLCAVQTLADSHAKALAEATRGAEEKLLSMVASTQGRVDKLEAMCCTTAHTQCPPFHITPQLTHSALPSTAHHSSYSACHPFHCIQSPVPTDRVALCVLQV
jgi:hypothetical protein